MKELMEGRRNDETPKTTKIQIFATCAMSGFGNCAHLFAFGSCGAICSRASKDMRTILGICRLQMWVSSPSLIGY